MPQGITQQGATSLTLNRNSLIYKFIFLKK